MEHIYLILYREGPEKKQLYIAFLLNRFDPHPLVYLDMYKGGGGSANVDYNIFFFYNIFLNFKILIRVGRWVRQCGYVFKASALCVHMCVCLSLSLCVCSLLRNRLNIFLPPLPEIKCPHFFEIQNPFGKSNG